jgi:hypothetical protein
MYSGPAQALQIGRRRARSRSGQVCWRSGTIPLVPGRVSPIGFQQAAVEQQIARPVMTSFGTKQRMAF